jgi:TM2 domain-containing membrane protein YozV
MIKFRCPGCPEVYSVEDRHGWETSSCPKCRADFRIPGDGPMPTPEPVRVRPAGTPESKRLLAALTALFLGAFGVHKFVLGYTKAGLIHLMLTVATCGLMKIVGIIEGIIYLTKTDAEFVKTYQVGTKEWF